MNIQGLGEWGAGVGHEDAPRRRLEEEVGGTEEVRSGQSDGPVDGAVDSEAGAAVGRPGASSGKMFCSPGVDTWWVEVPGSFM